MSLRHRKRVILAKLESVYGTDAAPTGADNAIQVSDLSAKVLEQESISRNIDRPHYGASAEIAVSKRGTASFKVELAGSGAAGTAPKYGCLLRACGMAEVITAGSKVVYNPVSDGHESVTLYVIIDKVLHKLTGARGTVSMELNAKNIPVLSFNMTGLISPVTDVVPGAVSYAGYIKPEVVNSTNSAVFTVHGFAMPPWKSVKFDLGNEVKHRLVVGMESVEIADRKVSGSMSFEATAVATKNWWQTIGDGTLGPLVLQHGTSAGNIVKFNAPQVQIKDGDYAEDEGAVMINANLILIPTDAGNDDLLLTFQ